MNRLQLLKRSVLIAAVIFAAVYLYGNRTQGPAVIKIPEIPQAPEGVEQEMKINGLSEEQKILSFDMTGYAKNGRKKWVIRGKSADIISEIVILNDIEADVCSDDRTVALKANRGRYDRKENSIRLEDNVIVTTSDGITLEAEWFKWNSETNKIITDSFVQVEKGALYASGYGASANADDEKVQLTKDVTVKQDDITINCGGPLIINYGENKASFYDNVEVIEPRGQMIADRLDIFFDPDSQKIESILAEGNVELKREQDIAKGQRLVYTLPGGEAVLTGNPEILIYSKKDLGDAFTGD